MGGGRTDWSGLAAIAALSIGGCYEGVTVDADAAAAADTDANGAETSASSESGSEATETTEDSTSGGETEPEAPTEPDEVVPLDGPAQDVEVACADASDSQRVATVSPDGDLWLLGSTEAGTEVHSVSPADPADVVTFTLPWTDVLTVQALGRTAGVVVASEGVFAWDGAFADEIRWPEHLPAPTGFCGDPSVDGDALVFADDVFTRDIGQWWRWNIPGEALADVRVAATTGACAGRSGTAYLLRGDTVWGVEDTWVAPLPRFSPAQAVAADDAFGLAAIVDGDLRVGDASAEQYPAWIQFEQQAVEALGATPGRLFVATEDRLYAHDEDGIVELTRDGESLQASAMHPDAAGGVWIESADGVCHVGGSAGVRVEGLRPYQTRRSNEIEVALELDADIEGVPSAALDGEAVPLTDLGSGRWALQLSFIEDIGWHELVVDVSKNGTAARRAVDFQVEPLANATWEDDIAPLFAQHCGTAACHGPEPLSDERPDLSEYEVWTMLSESIRDRVGETSDMPPLGSGDGSWGVDEVLLVVGWIDAGLPEGN